MITCFIDGYASPDPKELINDHMFYWWLCIPRPQRVNQWSHVLLMAMHPQTIITGDPLHSRAACTQPCNVNTHSRAHCSPGARLCEQWGHGCVQVPGCVEGHPWSSLLSKFSILDLIGPLYRGGFWTFFSQPSLCSTWPYQLSRHAIWVGRVPLPDGTKPLPEKKLTYRQWCALIFFWGQFHKRYFSHRSIIQVCFFSF